MVAAAPKGEDFAAPNREVVCAEVLPEEADMAKGDDALDVVAPAEVDPPPRANDPKADVA